MYIFIKNRNVSNENYKRLSRLLNAFKTNEITEEEINNEVEKALKIREANFKSKRDEKK